MNLAPVANNIFAVLTVIGQLMIATIIYGLLTKNKKILRFFSAKVLLLSFGTALISTLGSLIYSDVIGYEPCRLCWYQRILMYPQTILFGMALLKKKDEIIDYGMILSLVGAAIAFYHYLMQLNIVPAGDCAAVGYSVSCTQRFVLQFGYITIPLMALTGFLMIFFFGLAHKTANKK